MVSDWRTFLEALPVFLHLHRIPQVEACRFNRKTESEEILFLKCA